MATTQELLAQAYKQLGTDTTPVTTPTVSPDVVETPAVSPLEQFGRTVTGGFSRVLGSALPFGIGERIVPGAASLVDALSGVPLSEAYAQRRAQLAEMEKEFGTAAEETGATIFGMPISDVAGAFAMPLPKFVQSQSIAPRLVGGVVTPLTATEKAATIGTNLAKSFGTGATIVAGDAMVEKEGDLHAKVQAAKQAVKDVGPALAFGSAVGEAATIAAPLVTRVGEQLIRSSRGLRRVDVAGLKQPSQLRPGQSEATNLVKAIDYVDNKIGKSTNRDVVASKFIAEEQKVLTQIDDVLAKAKQQHPTVAVPEFNNTLEALQRGDISPHRVNDFLNELGDIQSSLAKESKGDLLYYQQAKKTYGQRWEPGKNDENNFYRAVYQDLREHIERFAPEVKKLNAEEANFVVARPIIDRFVKGQEQTASGMNMRRLFATTGGLGVPALLSQNQPELAVALGVPALALSTPGGERLTGALMRRIGRSITPGTAARISAVTGTLQNGQEPETAMPELTPTSDLMRRINSLLGPAEAQANVMPPEEVVKQRMDQRFPKASPEVREVLSGADELLQAIAYVESRGNPKARSPKGAAGLYQFMPGTAKSLGINPNDPAEALDGAKRYMDKLIGRFDSEQLALAAYNWGEGNVARAMKKVAASKKLDDWRKVSWSMIKNLAPTETQKYVPKVLALRESYITRG